MQFNTPAELKAWAKNAAAEDYKRHLPVHTDPNGTPWQVDKNPYCTSGARADWQRGFDNAPPRSYESPTANDFCARYQRGRAMAELLAALKD